ASVRQSSGFGNFSQVFTIRGLPLNTDDIAFNGLYGVLPRQIITTEALERVELFKGTVGEWDWDLSTTYGRNDAEQGTTHNQN
ncbi:Plug domain-containing protein, partial [Klebsiella pneumoniae]|uniref:Plug domain-containing protein n=1 Tax=Klebsiella pneumoniae TaxID=573 RepID=UPI002730D4AA